jgi:hypothetical protein
MFAPEDGGATTGAGMRAWPRGRGWSQAGAAAGAALFWAAGAGPAAAGTALEGICEALAQAELADLMPGGIGLSVSGPLEFDGVRGMTCAFGDMSGTQVSVSVSEDLGEARADDAIEAAAEEAALLRLMEGEDYVLETVEGLGAAAFWDPATGWLRVWPRDGNLLMILRPDGTDDPKALAEEAARRFLAVLPGGG